MESFQYDSAQIVPVFMKYGAPGMQRCKTLEQVIGQGNIKATAVFEFPDPKSFKEMIASE